MNVRMTWSAQSHQIVGVFVEDAQISAMMHFGGGPIIAMLTDSFRTAKCIYSSLAPKFAAEIPLIS